MITNRLELALERLQHSDWQRFEKLASTFLAAEFDDLRTVASPSGDEGRDSELFSPAAESKVLLQYSVSSDWSGKIGRTLQRIQKTFPHAIVLVYVSNQAIGAAADGLKRKVRQEHGISLDIRDRSWFVERVLGSSACEKAAEELAQIIVDPFLATAGVTSYAPSVSWPGFRGHQVKTHRSVVRARKACQEQFSEAKQSSTSHLRRTASARQVR